VLQGRTKRHRSLTVTKPRCTGPNWGDQPLPSPAQDMAADPYNPEGLPYSTSELTRPEYSTDDFRMFCFKASVLLLSFSWLFGVGLGGPNAPVPSPDVHNHDAQPPDRRSCGAPSATRTTGAPAPSPTPPRTRGGATRGASGTAPSPAPTTSRWALGFLWVRSFRSGGGFFKALGWKHCGWMAQRGVERSPTLLCHRLPRLQAGWVVKPTKGH
jgi:hypothetical protein